MATLLLTMAAALRMFRLQDVPPGLSQDEVLNADIVELIRSGNHALFFREGFGHEPLYHYWSVPFQILFGDNVFSIRLPAVYLGLLLVAATMRWVRREFGFTTAAFTGFGLAAGWWPVIFSRVGLRPILEPVLLVGFAWFFPRRPWVAGLLLGLSFYSYTAARVVVLIPVLMLVIPFVMQRRGRGISAARDSYYNHPLPVLTVFLIAGALYVPLGLTLRTDPTLQERLGQLEGPLVALKEGDLQPVLQSALATLGVFNLRGDPRWTYSLPARPLFDPLWSFLFVAGLILCFRWWRRAPYFLVLSWLAVTLLPSALAPQAPATVRLIGAMPVVYVMPALFIDWSLRRTVEATANARVLTVILAVLSVLYLASTIVDGFARWPAALETRDKYQSVLLDIGRHWRTSGQPAMIVATGFYEPITEDSLRRSIGADPGARWIQTGADVAGALVLPANQRESSRLFVPEFAAPAVSLMNQAGISSEPVYRSSSRPSFAIYVLPIDLPAPDMTYDDSFEGLITFSGYTVASWQENRPLEIFTFWRPEAPLPADLAIFIHLLSSDGNIIAQHDGFDAAPTTLEVGDLIIQRHMLPLPEGPLLSDWTLQGGLYTRHDGRRLTRDGSPSDRIILASHVPTLGNK